MTKSFKLMKSPIVLQFIKMFLVPIAYNFSRITAYYGQGWYIFTHNSSCRNYGTLTNCYITDNGYSASKPHKIINYYCFFYMS